MWWTAYTNERSEFPYFLQKYRSCTVEYMQPKWYQNTKSGLCNNFKVLSKYKVLLKAVTYDFWKWAHKYSNCKTKETALTHVLRRTTVLTFGSTLYPFCIFMIKHIIRKWGTDWTGVWRDDRMPVSEQTSSLPSGHYWGFGRHTKIQNDKKQNRVCRLSLENNDTLTKTLLGPVTLGKM